MKKSPSQPCRTAAMYSRVSSEEQEKEGYSIPAQQKLLKQVRGPTTDPPVWLSLWTIETAKKPGATGFQCDGGVLCRRIQKRRSPAERCRTLLVEKTDRLYRNLKDHVTIDELKIDIHFVKEATVLSPESHSSQKFMNGIKVLMAKQYIDNLSEETRKGLQEKAEQGIWPLRAPLGYRTIEAGNGKRGIEPDPDVAPLVAKLFEWYGTGRYTLDEVAEMAKDAGLLMPRTKRPLNRQKIHRVLGLHIYYGEFLWKGKRCKGVHQPLVTRELWDRTQAVLNERGAKKLRKVKHKLAFSGLIECGHCGCALVGEIQKKRYVYYHCSGFKGKCPEPYVREEVLEQKFTEIIQRLTFDTDILEWVSEALRDSHLDERRFHTEAVARLQNDYSRLQSRIEQMYLDKLDGRIDAGFFDQKSAAWRDEQDQILRVIKQHQDADQSYLEEGVALLELANRAGELFERQDAREKRRLLDFVLSNCSWKNGDLTPKFRQPFDIIADGAKLSAEKKAAGTASDDLRLVMGG